MAKGVKSDVPCPGMNVPCGGVRILLSTPVCPVHHSSHSSEVSEKVPQSRHQQNKPQRPFSHPTRHVVSWLPLVIQPMLGSLARSLSDLSGPQPQIWPANTSHSFLDFSFFKVSGANCQEHNVQCHNLTAELSPFPGKYFLPDLVVTGHIWTLMLGEESYAGFGIA